MYRIVNDANTQVEYIYMAAKSQESGADWYGDFIYYENYLNQNIVYELPELLRESFHWMRRYLHYFEYRDIDRQYWPGCAFRHEKKYKKYLKYGNNDSTVYGGREPS